MKIYLCADFLDLMGILSFIRHTVFVDTGIVNHLVLFTDSTLRNDSSFRSNITQFDFVPIAILC